jgi:hypothetical protein
MNASFSVVIGPHDSFKLPLLETKRSRSCTPCRTDALGVCLHASVPTKSYQDDSFNMNVRPVSLLVCLLAALVVVYGQQANTASDCSIDCKPFGLEYVNSLILLDSDPIHRLREVPFAIRRKSNLTFLFFPLCPPRIILVKDPFRYVLNQLLPQLGENSRRFELARNQFCKKVFRGPGFVLRRTCSHRSLCLTSSFCHIQLDSHRWSLWYDFTSINYLAESCFRARCLSSSTHLLLESLPMHFPPHSPPSVTK